MAKTNTIRSNSLQTNSVRLNGVEGLRRVSLQAGEIPDIPMRFTLSASVTNGKVSATKNGQAVSLPYTANEGDVIVLSVTPNDGYEFNGWADGNTDNPRTITMNADVALSAECVEVVQPPVGNYIQFEDKAVEAICVANWSSDGIGLTEEDAAKVTTIGTTFKGNTAITSFAESKYFTGVTSVAANAFDGCSNLRTISLDWNKVTSIGANAFRGCSSLQLEEVALPNLTTLGSSAFNGISALKRVSNLGSIPSVALQTFYKTGLLFIDLPATITEIGSQAFRYVATLEQVICRAATPPSLNSLAFQNTNDTFLIYVPDASLEAYKTATNWNQYADRIHPLSEIEGGHITTFEGLIGAYTFEGRSNEDADRDIVEDKSGYNNTLTLKSMQWGFIHNNLPDLIREGFWDDALWLSQSGYGEITLPNGLTDFTIIAKRFVFNANAGSNWSPLVGTGKSSGKGLFWLEYNTGNGKFTTNVNGLNYALSSLESEVTWLTNTHYNGHRLTGTQGNDVHDGMVYINKFRGDVISVRYQKIYAIYLFNRQLSPSEIEAFIKEKIDASYVLPTIEQ